MSAPLKKPCRECPWLKKSAGGWLGAATPVEFLQTSEAEHRMPCHIHVDYNQEDWQEKAKAAPQCAGRAIHFANRCKTPKDKSLLVMAADREAVFSNPQDFVNHHTLGEDKPQIMIVGPRVMVLG